MKQVVITGAGGFIGGALTKYLLECVMVVYGVDVSNKRTAQFVEYRNFIPDEADSLAIRIRR